MPRPKNEIPNFRIGRIKDKRYDNGQRPNYYILWTERGESKNVSTGTEDEKHAQRQLEEFKEEYLAPEKEGLTVATIIDEYLKYKKSKYAQVNAPEKRYTNLKFKLVAPKEYFGHLLAEQISRRMGRDFYDWRHKRHDKKYGKKKHYKPISNATIRAEGVLLNAALNYAFKEEWIDRFKKIELPQDAPPRERRLSSDEKKKLIEACKAHHIKLFTIIALTTGQRKTAILELKWSQVDMINRLIKFNPPGRYITNKRRSAVPINNLLYSCLEEAKTIADTEFVIEWNGKEVKKMTFGFKQTCKRAGLNDVSPHTLRHTAACDMAARGVPMEKIAVLLGDSIRTIEKHYLKYSPDYLSDAVKALEVL